MRRFACTSTVRCNRSSWSRRRTRGTAHHAAHDRRPRRVGLDHRPHRTDRTRRTLAGGAWTADRRASGGSIDRPLGRGRRRRCARHRLGRVGCRVRRDHERTRTRHRDHPTTARRAARHRRRYSPGAQLLPAAGRSHEPLARRSRTDPEPPVRATGGSARSTCARRFGSTHERPTRNWRRCSAGRRLPRRG